MSIGPGIFWKLSNAAAVTAIVGGQIFADSSPSNQYPLVVYNFTNNTKNLLDRTPVTQEYALIVTSIAKDYDTAHDLANAVTAALNRQKGVWDGVTVQGCYYQPDETEQTTPQDHPQLKYFSITQTFKFLTY